MIELTHFGPCGVLDAEELALVALSVCGRGHSEYRHTFTRKPERYLYGVNCPCGDYAPAVPATREDCVIVCRTCGAWHSVQWRESGETLANRRRPC